MTSTTYTIDTNAGPVHVRDFDSPEAVKAFMEAHIPLLRRTGYTAEWVAPTQQGWTMVIVRDGHGNEQHRAAFRPGR